MVGLAGTIPQKTYACLSFSRSVWSTIVKAAERNLQKELCSGWCSDTHSGEAAHAMKQVQLDVNVAVELAAGCTGVVEGP